MINSLIDALATKLVTLNPWLSEVRHTGYLVRDQADTYVTDFIKSIGIDDREANSGYIRFQSDRDANVQELSGAGVFESCQVAQRVTLYLRLVIVAKTELPGDIAFRLSMQFNSLSFTDFRGRNVEVRAQSWGTNTDSIVLQETGKKDLNTSYRALFIDFTLSFDQRQSTNICDIPIDMNCENQNFLDKGCLQHCEEMDLGFPADYTGNATLKTSFNGITRTKIIPVVNGENIVIPLSDFNEDYLYTMELFNADGERIMISDNAPTDTEYESLRVKITP